MHARGCADARVSPLVARPRPLAAQTAWGALLALVGAAIAAVYFSVRALLSLARDSVYVVYTFPVECIEYKWMERWLAARPEVAACTDARVQLYAPVDVGGGDGDGGEDEDEELVRAASRRGAVAASGLASLVLQAAGGDALRLRARVLPEHELLLKYAGARVWVTRPTSEAGDAPRAVQLTMLRAHGERTLAAALREARELHTASQSGQLVIYEAQRGVSWCMMAGVRAVSLPEIVLPPADATQPALMTALLDDMVRFLDSESWYAQRGIPYHRGYLLYGPGGCGKTMAVHAAATELRLPVFSIDLLAPGLSDDTLVSLFERVRPPSLILMENVDRVFDASRARVPPPPGGASNADTSRITFSGLLNVLDGVYSRPGCCTIFTSCAHPDAQSRALMRDGRVDLKLTVPAATPAAGARLFASFFATHPFHELSPAQLAADTAAFEVALARRGADAQQAFSMRDITSYLATRSPQEALSDVEVLGLNAAQVAARALASVAAGRGAADALAKYATRGVAV